MLEVKSLIAIAAQLSQTVQQEVVFCGALKAKSLIASAAHLSWTVQQSNVRSGMVKLFHMTNIILDTLLRVHQLSPTFKSADCQSADSRDRLSCPLTLESFESADS